MSWCVSTLKAPAGLLFVSSSSTTKLLLGILLHLLVMLKVWWILRDDVHGLDLRGLVYAVHIIGLWACVQLLDADVEADGANTPFADIQGVDATMINVVA